MAKINRKTDAKPYAKQTQKVSRQFSVILALLFGVGLALLPQVAAAASLYFSPSSGSYNVGQTFSVSVYVSSADQAMNAASGVISFPSDKLEVASLSKSGSIFSLWVQEPSFSNSAGTVNFEGIVLNPGFTGSGGKVITLIFRAKAAGNALLTLSSGSVLANDGQGTNILTSMGNASFSFSLIDSDVPEAKTLSVVAGIPAAPQISSLTHPDPNKWYAKKDAKFVWQVPSGIVAVRLLYDKYPNSQPKVVYEPATSEKEINDIRDGIYYFHAQFKNKNGWGSIAHFKFQIDNQPPNPFQIIISEGRQTTNPQPTLFFETTDEISGIDHYEIIIDKESPIETEKSEYKMPLQDLGKHNIIVKAIDKAGNATLAMTDLEILPIEAPKITDYPREVLPGSIISLKGTAVPEATIKVYLQQDNQQIKTGETKSDASGKWIYTEVEPVEKGVYLLWAQAMDIYGAKSEPSEKITVLVNPPAFLRIGKLAIDYLTTIITLLVFILLIVLGTFWILQRIKNRKRKLRKEANDTEKALYQAFKVLKKEIEEQVAKLDGKPGLSEREKKVCDDLKEALRISEKFVGKKIKDIKKELQ